MILKIKSISLLGALFCFFLPWLDFKCNGMDVTTQSGVQSIYGDTKNFALVQPSGAQKEKVNMDLGDHSRNSFLTGLALVALVGAIFFTLRALKTQNRSGKLVPILVSFALVSIVAQMIIGFPGEKDFEKFKVGASSGETKGRLEDFNFDLRYTPWIFVELLLLAIPIGLSFRKEGN